MENINEVYNKIQAPTYPGDKRGMIIYANQFSGLNPVEIPPEFKEALNSDFGEIGNNILVQLEQKVLGFPNGPWYIDSRDGIIYIHNRKFHEEPVHQYNYKAENGELIKVDFQTQYTTKSTRGSVSTGIDPEKKLTIDVNKGDYVEYIADDDATTEERKALTKKAYEDYINGKLSYDQFVMVTEYNKTTSSEWAWFAKGEQQRRLKDKSERDSLSLSVETERNYQEYKAAGGGKKGEKYLIDKYIDNMLKDPNTKNLGNEVEKMLEALAVGKLEGVEGLMREMNKAAKAGTLEEYVRHLVGNNMHLLNNAEWDTNPCTYVVKEVDSRSYSKYRARVSTRVGRQKARPNYDYEVKRAKDGFSRLLKDPGVKVLSSNAYTVGDKNGIREYNFKIKIFVKQENTVTQIPQYRLLQAYYSRKKGITGNTWSEIERKVKAAGNAHRRITERKLVCKLTCVGNPKLESSDIIEITGVGKHWSGAWYIKSCIHQMNSQSGYTCLLDLVKNRSIPAVSSTSASINTTHAAANSTTKKAVTTKAKESKGVGGEVSFWLDSDEPIYYSRLNTLKKKRDFIMMMMAAKYKDPYYRKYGIVVRDVNSASKIGSSQIGDLRIDPKLKLTNEEVKKYGKKAEAFLRNMENLSKK